MKVMELQKQGLSCFLQWTFDMLPFPQEPYIPFLFFTYEIKVFLIFKYELLIFRVLPMTRDAN